MEPDHLSNNWIISQGKNREVKEFLERTMPQTECFLKKSVQLAALSEVLSSIPSNHMVPPNHL